MATLIDAMHRFQEVFGDPRLVARYLALPGVVYGLRDIEVRVVDPEVVVFWLTLDPWAPMTERGYPTERVSISVRSDRRVTAVPIDPTRRSWQHRYPYILGDLAALGHLCLWHPHDPRALRWSWDDGFTSYVTVVHRHLQAEEFFRREGYWPSEDTPHGEGDCPIRTLALWSIVAKEGA